MLKANQRGERIVNFFIKVYAVIYPTVLFMECFGSAIYSQFRYGTITPETLLYPFRVMYVLLSFVFFFCIHTLLWFFNFLSIYWFHVHVHRLPWNQKTIAGWLVEVVYSIFAAASLSFINPAFLTFFISICEYHGAFSEMFQHQLNDIDQITRNNAYNITKVKQLLFKTVSMHVSAKKWGFEFGNLSIYSNMFYLNRNDFVISVYFIKQQKCTVPSYWRNWFAAWFYWHLQYL